VRKVLDKYEAKFGKRGTSDMTVDKVPLDQLVGSAYLIDVPTPTSAELENGKSPQITLEQVQAQDRQRPIKPGDVVIFRTGYSDKYLQPLPAGNRMMAEPLAGKAPGWAAPQPEVIMYLADKGVRLIGTDGPTMGGVDPQQALMVYWAAGSRGVCLVEYLTALDSIKAPDAYFLFGPIKLKNAHGGYGRAIALY
jgi:kynurenine formamidase